MAVHGFIARHRLAARVLTPVALGIALLVLLAWALWSAPPRTTETRLTASTTECHDMVTLSIAGRYDTPRPGTTKMLVDERGNELPAASAEDYVSTWIDEAANAPLAVVGEDSYAAMYIAYPADMASYDRSVATGVANTERVMQAIRVSCPDTKFAIVGYSEGADVARRVAMNVGHQEAAADGTYGIVDPANVVGVVIIADPGRAVGQGPFPGAENPFTNPDGFDLEYQNGRDPVSGVGVLPGTGGSDFGALAGRVASFCSEGDLTCAAPQNISLLQLVVNVGRQLNIDALERDGLTPATGIDVATVLSRIVFDAFVDIESQPDWMAGDETFMTVLLRVSDPDYERPAAAPTTTTTPPATPADADDPDAEVREGDAADSGDAEPISSDELSPLAYLPQKLFKEVVGLLLTNQNTIPVIMSDPWQLTLAAEVGHHFDYWRDSGPARPLTSVQYAAAWLTHLAQQVQAGQSVDPAAVPSEAELVAAVEEIVSDSASGTTDPGNTVESGTTPDGAPTPDGSAPSAPAAAPQPTSVPDIAVPASPTSSVPAPAATTPELPTSVEPTPSTVPPSATPATAVPTTTVVPTPAR